jgi:hypothetical protein
LAFSVIVQTLAWILTGHWAIDSRIDNQNTSVSHDTIAVVSENGRREQREDTLRQQLRAELNPCRIEIRADIAKWPVNEFHGLALIKVDGRFA